MSVQLKLSAIESINSASLTSVVELSNFNFGKIRSAIEEFLGSINYSQGSTVTVDIEGISANTLIIREGLTVYGAQQQNGTYPEVIKLNPSGTASAKNFIAEDAVEGRRLRLKVYGLLPSTGVPGEIVYITAQGGRVEGFYGYLLSTGWTLLSGAGGAGAECTVSVTRTVVPAVISGDNTQISNGLLPIPAPISTTEYLLFVNGVFITIGDGNIGAVAYFSKDGGSTATPYQLVDATDALYWNSSVAGYGLDSNDSVTIIYYTVDPYCASSGVVCYTSLIEAGDTTTTFSNLQMDVTIDSPISETSPVTVCQVPVPTSVQPGIMMTLGYSIPNSIFAYDISSPISGTFIIKFTIPDTFSEDDFNMIRIFHLVDGIYVDETILDGIYTPDFGNHLIYAQSTSLSPFYVIPYVEVATTTTTTSSPGFRLIEMAKPEVEPVCPANLISYQVSNRDDASQVSFTGSPSGPFMVRFVDITGKAFDLTGLHKFPITLSWVFNRFDPEYSSAGVNSVYGTYTFIDSNGCSYVVSVIQRVTTTTTRRPATTTTTTQPTTTTTTQPTTTTTTTHQEQSTTTTTTDFCDGFTKTVTRAREGWVKIEISGKPGSEFTIKKAGKYLHAGITPSSVELKVYGEFQVEIGGVCKSCYNYDSLTQLVSEISC